MPVIKSHYFQASSNHTDVTSWMKNLPSSQGEELGKAMQKKIAKKILSETKPNQTPKKTCICAPTSHAGSFKCHLHRNSTPKTKPSKVVQVQDRLDSFGMENTKKLMNSKKLMATNSFIYDYEQPQLSRFGRAAAAATAQASHDGSY